MRESRNLEDVGTAIIGLVQSRLEPDIRRRLRERREKDRENILEMIRTAKQGEED